MQGRFWEVNVIKILETLIKEFITIVELLEQCKPVENDRIVIEREEFQNLLNKYDYMNFRQKTRIYKQLNFIIHDKNNYTMPCKTPDKKTARRVVINYQTYLTIKELYEA